MADLTPPIQPTAATPEVYMADNIEPHDPTKSNGSAPIPKPAKFSLERFKSKRASEIANVGVLLGGLPHHKISDAKDFVRVSSNPRHITPELCFVNVPITGAKKDVMHIIDEDLAMQYLESAVIKRFRLVLASKPGDKFFFCHVPINNLDNTWNASALTGINNAKQFWTKVTSRSDEEGVEGYVSTFAREQDAFPTPEWPTQSLDELIEKTFEGRIIEDADHPGLARLIGSKPVIK